MNDSDGHAPVTKDEIPGHESDLTDSDELAKDTPKEVAEELQFERSLNSAICMIPELGPSVTRSDALNIAPAEGQIPVCTCCS